MNGAANTQMITAGWAVVGLYAAVILFFVVRGARRNRSMADYALGNLSFSPVAVGLALAASMTSVSPEAVRMCQENGITVIPGSCPNQFLKIEPSPPRSAVAHGLTCETKRCSDCGGKIGRSVGEVERSCRVLHT